MRPRTAPSWDGATCASKTGAPVAPPADKLDPFECGAAPLQRANVRPLSVKYYPIAIFFLLQAAYGSWRLALLSFLTLPLLMAFVLSLQA